MSDTPTPANKFIAAREAFLDMLADGDWEIEYDADTNSAGRPVDCSTFQITGSIQSLSDLCEALDIVKAGFDQTTSLEDAIQKAIEQEPAWAQNPINPENSDEV